MKSIVIQLDNELLNNSVCSFNVKISTACTINNPKKANKAIAENTLFFVSFPKMITHNKSITDINTTNGFDKSKKPPYIYIFKLKI